MTGIDLSVIIPTYNEAENIEEVLTSVYDALAVDEDSLEVIVVDESSDTTPAIVRSMDRPNLRLIHFDDQRGLGPSVAAGIEEADGTFVGVIDADGQHPPEKLMDLYREAETGEYDLVVGSRYVEDGGIANWTYRRFLVSKGATIIAWLILPADRRITDPMSGFFVFRRAALNDTLQPIGYKILLEILLKADIQDIKEIGYVFEDREKGESKLGLGDYLQYLRHVSSLLIYRLQNLIL